MSQNQTIEKAKAIAELLQSNNFNANDPDTLLALAMVLVNACAFNGATKKSFMGTIRDLWRGAIIKRDFLISQNARGLTGSNEEPKLDSKEEVNG